MAAKPPVSWCVREPKWEGLRMPTPHRRRRVFVSHLVAAVIAASLAAGLAHNPSSDAGWCDLFPHWPTCHV